jgi:hypothetical protein
MSTRVRKQAKRFEDEQWEAEELARALRAINLEHKVVIPPAGCDSEDEPELEDALPAAEEKDVGSENGEEHEDEDKKYESKGEENSRKISEKKRRERKDGKNAEKERKWSGEFKDLESPEFADKDDAGPILVREDHEDIRFFLYQLLDDRAFELMVRETNRYGSSELGWRDVSRAELEAFLGVFILMGIIRMPAIHMYWNCTTSISSIKEAFKRERWQQVHNFFHLADNLNLPARGLPGHDRLGKVRPLFNLIMPNLQAIYSPGRDLSVDESMVAFKGRCSFRQYMPLKPVKRGFKIWCISVRIFSRLVIDIEIYL